jgi:chaperone required for assembly of F1-ATPase
VDEDWNMAFWGRDALALERRAFRFAEMQAAATVLAALH